MAKEDLKKTEETQEQEQETAQQETNTTDLSETQQKTLEKHKDDLNKAKAKKPGLWKRFTNSKPIKFVRKHKKEIAFGAGAALLAGGAYYLGRDQGRREAPSDYLISDGEEVNPLEADTAAEVSEVSEESEPVETTEDVE